MVRIYRIFGLLFLGLLGSGCGGSDGGSPVVATPKHEVEHPSPDKVAHQFMMTIKTGDEQQASKLLTEKARQEVERTGMDVMASGSQTMEFTIDGVEYIGEAKDGAHVAATISDVDADQNRVTNQVLWFLRKEPIGWRVAGIAIKIFQGEDPVLYIFEDPEEAARQQQLVVEEVERRAAAAAQQASSTQATSAPGTALQSATQRANQQQPVETFSPSQSSSTQPVTTDPKANNFNVKQPRSASLQDNIQK